MDIIVISTTALIASTLTLFSGFGLGTLLMPVVAVFFPLEIAIAVTAIVHLANNLFKAVLLGRQANYSVLLRFGIPAVIFAFCGALVLHYLSTIPAIFQYTVFDNPIQVLPVKLIIGLLILSFVVLELSKHFSAMTFNKQYLTYGGAISGFFGGLSGHQGAFRSMFLLKAGLDKETFVATSIMLAIMVDIARLLIYGWDISAHYQDIHWPLVLAATLSAFIGAFCGARLLKKLTIKTIQTAVSILLIVIAMGLITGVL